MCTMIVEAAEIHGSGKGTQGWFKLSQVSVSYDHPFHASLEHAVNLDFVNEKEGWGKRVAVEITPESARQLVQVIERVLARSEPS